SLSFNAPAPPPIPTLSLHDALPISFTTDGVTVMTSPAQMELAPDFFDSLMVANGLSGITETRLNAYPARTMWRKLRDYPVVVTRDRKSTRLNSSHVKISYAVFCLKK